MPKKVDHDVRRRAIATAAIAVIDETGLDRARLRDVASAAAVTTGAVTHYFGSKDDVLEAALAEIVARILEGQRAARAAQTNLIDAAAMFLPLDAERRREWRVWLAFWGRAIKDERLRRLHQKYYAEMSGELAAILADAQASGLLPRDRDTRTLADAIIAAVDGVGIRATLEPESWPPERQRATLQLMLVPLAGALSGEASASHQEVES